MNFCLNHFITFWNFLFPSFFTSLLWTIGDNDDDDDDDDDDGVVVVYANFQILVEESTIILQTSDA